MREDNSSRRPLRLVRRPDGSLAPAVTKKQPNQPKSVEASRQLQPSRQKSENLSEMLGMSDDGTPLDENGNPIKKEKKFDWEETKELTAEFLTKFKQKQKAKVVALKNKAKLSRKKKVSSGAVQSSTSAEGTKRIEIALTLPDTEKIKKKSLAKISKLSKKQKIISIGAAVVLVVLVGANTLRGGKPAEQTENNGVLGSQSQKIPTNQSPEFAVLKPSDKKVENLGGFARVSPPGSAAAYTFVDNINGTPIKVTQQEIPPNIKEKPVVGLEKLAKDFNASQIVQIDDVAAYIGLSEQGPQTLIFLKDGLLVFIVAEREVPELQWVEYVSKLDK